jgi:C2 domain
MPILSCDLIYIETVYTLNLEQLLSGTPLGSLSMPISYDSHLLIADHVGFFLWADAAAGVLRVEMISARDLKGTKLGGGTPDPYISLKIENRAELARTKFKPSTYVDCSYSLVLILTHHLNILILIACQIQPAFRFNALPITRLV